MSKDGHVKRKSPWMYPPARDRWLYAPRSSAVCLALFDDRWHLEIHAPVVVDFVSGLEIQIGEEDLMSEAAGEVKERVPDDGIVFDVGFVAVLENQGCRR